MFKTVNSITIVGGGTSAWFTAAFYAKRLNSKITLVDKEVGSPVGVGEGTLLNFDKFLRKCGFATTEWFDEIDATYKAGILFPNWGRKNNLVWHPFYLDTTFIRDGKETSMYEAWTHMQEDYDLNDLGAHFHESISNRMDIVNTDDYAMHVDAGKLVKWIQEQIKDKITIIKSEVVEIARNDEDFVTKLICKNGQEIESDVYIDCTGFKQLLHNNPKRVNLEGRLFCDTAVAGHVPYQNVEQERHPYVISEAVDHGWIWNIPVQTRIGSGLVFNRSITDPEEAKKFFCNYWDNRIKPEDLKVIDWTPYYLDNPWHKNVVTIGLSAGFIEPLESTGLGMIIGAVYESAAILKAGFYTNNDIDLFNSVHRCIYEDSIDFINMHYAYTDFDTPFWNFVKNTHIFNNRHKWFQTAIVNGDHLEREGRGHMFGGANWNCWLLQIEPYIAPNKSVTKEEARSIIEEWRVMSTRNPTETHTHCIEWYPRYLDLRMEGLD